jgi:hypothetical protein
MQAIEDVEAMRLRPFDRDGTPLRREENMHKGQQHNRTGAAKWSRRISTRRSALAVAAAMLVAPTTASAYFDQPAPGSTAGQASPPKSRVHVVQVTSDPGFDWGDAAIGAGGVVGAIALGIGCAAGSRKLRARSDRGRTPAPSRS